MTVAGMSVLTRIRWPICSGQLTIADLRPLDAVGINDLGIHDQTNVVAIFANANRSMRTPGESVEMA